MRWIPEWISDGVYRWNYYSPGHRVDLTSHLIVSGDTGIYIDPTSGWIPPEISGPIKLGYIFLTNSNHERASVAASSHLHWPVLASRRCQFASRYFQFRPVEIPGTLPGGWEVFHLDGAAQGEVIYINRLLKTAIFGDSVVNLPSRSLEILPEKYCRDRDLLKSELNEWCSQYLSGISVCLFAHGKPLFHPDTQALASLS